MPPKKVAIIGAGPSGLVTAKTLLHNFPHGTFSPVIFDSRYELGGLWSSPRPGNKSWGTNHASGSLDPSMRTNLSRFSVAFSDLSWESVLGTSNVPMFPQARQVCQYLKAYRKRYIPDDVMRLGCRVLKTVRTTKNERTARWEVSWIKERSDQIPEEIPSRENTPEVEEFDLLVIASGYFARPYIPEIPGLHHTASTGGIFHSSEIQTTHEILQDKESILTRGNIAIIGGSISGAEAASTVALHQSSYSSKDPISQSLGNPHVHHIYTRPFWSLPTYLPHKSSEDTVSFLPLDLVMYDLGRRPPGPVEYGLGLIPEEKAAKTNEYFSSLLGAYYKSGGQLCSPNASKTTRSRPPWVAIGNDYAEFVQSGRIESTMGRAVSAHADPETGLYNIEIEIENGETKTLKDIAAVVMATGFTPFEALSFLPREVLSVLEYSTDDPFLPLVLDKGGTIRSEIPDIGFVGFYRGPYWGVMEMQARFLGMEWAKQSTEMSKVTEQIKGMRILREPASNSRRSQFPMGDYVGLMEVFARDLEITRTAMSNGEGRSGPVVPSRYPYDETSSAQQTDMKEQTKNTLKSLEAFLSDVNLQAGAAAMAIFRALQGNWAFQRVRQDTGEPQGSGTVNFCPVYPSDSAYDKEYICEERLEPYSTEDTSSPSPTNRSIFRVSESMSSGTASQIQILAGATNGRSDIKSAKSLLLGPLRRKKCEGEYVPGEYVIQGRVTSANAPGYQPEVQDHNDLAYDYTFNFEGVSIVSWERLDELQVTQTEGEPVSHATSLPRTRTLHRR